MRMPDNLTANQRRYCMSRIGPKDTGIEKALRSRLQAKGLRFRKHDARLPGKPDVVFVRDRLVVFIDGDFWHGYRFPQWCDGLSLFWQKKIGETRKRDTRNFAKLRRMGWRVIRIWQHQIERDLDACVARVLTTLGK